jgi:hypothetical protein
VYEVSSIAKNHSASSRRQDLLVIGDSNVNSAVRQFFKPYVLAFVALAVLVGGCSYGYKLSQYFQHSEVSRVSYSRMWVDHRDSSAVAPLLQRVPRNQVLGAEPPLGTVPRDVRPAYEQVTVEASPALEAFIFSSLIPLRAPPSITLSLS